jgi:hypothetical protein
VPGPALVGCMWNPLCRMRITGLKVQHKITEQIEIINDITTESLLGWLRNFAMRFSGEILYNIREIS